VAGALDYGHLPLRIETFGAAGRAETGIIAADHNQ
jgi:hypothetical protein